MLACFHELGYSVEWRVINAADYGFAQRRRRVFIFAFRNDTTYAKNINRDNLKSMIHKDGFFIKKFPITQDESTDVSRVEGCLLYTSINYLPFRLVDIKVLC